MSQTNKKYSNKTRNVRASNSAVIIFFQIFLFLGSAENSPAQTSEKIQWRNALIQEKAWYGSEEAKRIADNVLLYQNNNGGWLKNIDMAEELDKAARKKLQQEKSQKLGTTIDNGATHTQLRYLAKVFEATGEQKYKSAFLKGVDFLLEAQYENGGWPQFYPVREGYYEHITFNDDAMIGVMNLLKDIAYQKEPYQFVDKERCEKSKNAIDKGLKIILKTQVEVNGKLTVWGAQHDRKNLQPAKARAYELPSLSGKESVTIIEYLMEIEDPGEDVKKAVRSAVTWFEENKIMDKEMVWVEDSTLPRGYNRLVKDKPGAGPLWARFYQIGTNKPIYVGRDGKLKETHNEIEAERRVGYSYLGNYAEGLLKYKYPEWEKRIK